MVHEAMIVETALPTMSSDTGKVARAGVCRQATAKDSASRNDSEPAGDPHCLRE